MILALDLSLKSSGYAKFTNDGKLVEKNTIVPAKEINNALKIHYITSKIELLFEGIEDIIVEDLYYGLNFAGIKDLARLSGAVLYAWMSRKYKEPIFYMASHARKLVGVRGSAHKTEIQLFVLEKYKFSSKSKTKTYKEKYDNLIEEFPIVTRRKGITKEEKKQSKKNKGKLNYRLNKLSNKIWKETGIGEDIADAIILGLAYHEDNKNEKEN